MQYSFFSSHLKKELFDFWQTLSFFQMVATEPGEKKEDEDEKLEECKAAEHHDKVPSSESKRSSNSESLFFQFDPQEYLQSFYKSALEDSAMNIVLFFLPGILYRLPEKIKSVLDLGAGIHH